MKIIDLWVATYYSLMKKYEIKGIIASVSLLQYFWGMNIISILSFLSPIVTKGRSMNFIPVVTIIGILGIASALLIRNRLDKRYNDNYEYIEQLSKRIPKAVAILVLVIHFLVTICAFFFCFRSFRFLIR